MLRIGMIGSENSHSKAVSKLINVEKGVRGVKVVSVWGETKAFAKETAEAGQIPKVVKDPTEMIGDVDGVMIDHRHGKYHLPVATEFIKAGIPVFVDKPLCCSLAEGKKYLQLAKSKGVPTVSFSSIPTQKMFRKFQDEVASLNQIVAGASAGPCDLKSKYGGVFFYGIHQVDALIELFGMDVTHVELKKNGPQGLAILYYKDGKMVTMHCLKGGSHTFQFMAHGEKIIQFVLAKRDKNPYLTSTKMWIEMMNTGKEPIEHRRMLAPVAVLEALQKALDTGKKVKVGKF
ncbi:MAG: Gfo/Idh/MocA family oxidoreductase [Planctomycetes bacterium]|nr:Gfo/Idh/MocA family oxidoreductase [Planctomycetota bacterium]